MQEVFNNIVEKFQSKIEALGGASGSNEVQDVAVKEIEWCKEIVEKFAKEFATDTNVGSNGWIPVSERMPNQDGEFSDVLITCESIADGVFAQSAEFYIAADGEPVFDALYHYERVLAWMPLPQPYTNGE